MKLAFKWASLALYRGIFRKCCRINCLNPPKLKNIGIPPIDLEINRYNECPTEYAKWLQTEFLMAVRHEFSLRYISNDVSYHNVLYGTQINELLESSLQENQIIPLMEAIVEYRAKVQQRIKKRIDRRKDLENKTAIANDRLSDSKKLKIESKRRSNRSDVASMNLLQRYLKQAQTHHTLPNPFLLPYTNMKNVPILELVQSKHLIHRSVAVSTIKNAYDWEYLEAVIIPSIEYEINRDHLLEHLRTVVEEKGPYKVKICTTNAAAQAFTFIRTPLPRRREMEQLALDIKELVQVDRVIKIWNGQPNLTDHVNKDGSFTIRRAGSNRGEQRMYPKTHYEKWAEWEALGDHFNGENITSLFQEWSKFIEMASSQLEHQEKMVNVGSIHNLRGKKNALFLKQVILQEHQDVHYDKLVANYKSLIEELEAKNVHEHSELLNGDINTSTGIGKGLGDYMKMYGVKYYKTGMPFDKWILFKMNGGKNGGRDEKR